MRLIRGLTVSSFMWIRPAQPPQRYAAGLEQPGRANTGRPEHIVQDCQYQQIVYRHCNGKIGQCRDVVPG